MKIQTFSVTRLQKLGKNAHVPHLLLITAVPGTLYTMDMPPPDTRTTDPTKQIVTARLVGNRQYTRPPPTLT